PEILDRGPTRGFDIRQHRYLAMDAIKVVNRDLDPSLTRNHRQMEQRVGGPAHCGMNDDGVLEGFTRQDASGGDLLPDELEDLFASGTGIAQELSQWCRDERRARQGQTQRLRQDLAGAGAAHELAGTARRTRPM